MVSEIMYEYPCIGLYIVENCNSLQTVYGQSTLLIVVHKSHELPELLLCQIPLFY